MSRMRQRSWMLAVMALLMIVFAGCKSESASPTSPTTTQPPTSTSGGTTPPVSPNVAVTVSNANPLTNSTSIITATVTLNGANVPNGTAVEFATTSPGSFTESGSTALLRTTTSGVATATLTSNVAGVVPVTVTVNNVTKAVTVKFSDQVNPPPPPNTTVTITGISPASGKPQGGDQITITGTNFKSPVRVLFDTGTGTPKEGFVVSVTPTQIVVVTPAVDLGPSAQTLAATVTVISSAGNADEQRAVSATKFTFALQVLTPIITTVTPNSGPIDGGTRVTIVGEGFQQPVQVFFGAAEAQVIQINFNQIIAMTPVASFTSPVGSGAVTGFVDLRVLNINSNKSGTLTNAFRYVAKAVITAMGPTEGPFTGGTRVSIDGSGFNDPVTVQFAGVAGAPIKVSGTQIIAITGAVKPTGCADITGPTTMNNVDNGDAATGPPWTYRVPKAAIVNVHNPATLGGTTTITVLNAFGIPRITIGGKTVNVVSAVDNGDGTTTFTVQVPSTLTLTTAACVNAPNILAQQPTSFDVIYLSLLTQCTDTAVGGLTVNPSGGILVVAPPALQTFTATAAVPPSGTSAGTPFKPATPQSFVIGNGGLGVLTVQSVTTSGCTNFQVTSNPVVPPAVALNRCDTLPVTVTYNAAGLPPGTTETCSIVIVTDAGTFRMNVTGTVQ